MEKIGRSKWRNREKVVDRVDGIAAGAAIAEEVIGGVCVVGAETTPFVLSACTRVCDEHVRHRDSDKLSIARDP